MDVSLMVVHYYIVTVFLVSIPKKRYLAVLNVHIPHFNWQLWLCNVYVGCQQQHAPSKILNHIRW